MAENKIVIELSAGTDELIKAFNTADKAAVKFSANVIKSIAPIKTAATEASNSISGGFKDAFNSIGKGVAVGNLVTKVVEGAFDAVVNFATGSVNAAAEQEAALNRLSQALKASGDFSEQAVKDFEDFASALQATTIYGDEVVVQQLAIAKSFGATNDQAKELVKAAANLAATFGGTLDERLQQLAKTLDGTAGKLNEQIPALRTLTAEQLKAGGAARIVNENFGGAAQNEINSYNGKLTQTKNALSDLQEDLGNLVVKNGLVITSLNIAKEAFVSLGGIVKDVNVALGVQPPTDEQKAASVETLAKQYGDLQVRIEAAQAAIEKGGTDDWLDNLFFSAEKAKKELVNLQTEQDKIFKKLNAPAPITPVSTGTGVDKDKDTRTQEEKDAAAKILAERESLNEQLKIQRAEYDAFEANLNLQKDTLTQEQRAVEYENLLTAEQAKIEAIRNAEIAKAQIIKDEQLKQATIKAANDKADLSRQKSFADNQSKLQKEITAMERQEANTRLSIASNYINAGLALTREGSLAQKALAITQATISTYQGAANALADTRPATLGPAVAASIIAVGLANVAKIAGAKFASGGIVEGTSYVGDRVPALLNSREMVLNMDQQRQLFSIANGNGGSNQSMIETMREIVSELRNTPIVIEANSREIGRLIRDEQRNGFEVLA
jgi:hypothetical protein